MIKNRVLWSLILGIGGLWIDSNLEKCKCNISPSDIWRMNTQNNQNCRRAEIYRNIQIEIQSSHIFYLQTWLKSTSRPFKWANSTAARRANSATNAILCLGFSIFRRKCIVKARFILHIPLMNIFLAIDLMSVSFLL